MEPANFAFIGSTKSAPGRNRMSAPRIVSEEKAAEIAADWVTSFYHLQVGALETQDDALVKKQIASLRQADTLFKDAISIVEIYRKKHPELDQYIPSVDSTQRSILLTVL
jgi:hypothetical protein